MYRIHQNDGPTYNQNTLAVNNTKNDDQNYKPWIKYERKKIMTKEDLIVLLLVL